jgi:hypothetical protein
MDRHFAGAIAALLVFAAIVFLWMKDEKQLRLKTCPDSASYLHPIRPLSKSLQSERTLAYPAFLGIVLRFSPSLSALPKIQFCAHVAAIVVFAMGLRWIGFGSWPAVIVSGPLLFSSLFQAYVGHVMTDSVGLSLAIAAVGFLLMTVSRPERWLPWVACTFCLFASYQLRPAYLFMLGWLPVTGILLFRTLASADAWRTNRKRMTMRLLSIAGVPFLAFCCLRWVVVDHFGLVSYGGSNVIGIAGQFLNEEAVDDLPPRLRPLANQVLRICQQRLEASWKASSMADSTAGRYSGCLSTSGHVRMDYPLMIQLYNPTTHSVWRVAAREVCGTDSVAMNNVLTDAAHALIRLRPDLYIRWFWNALEDGVSQAVTTYTNPHMLTYFLLLAVAYYGTIHMARMLCGRSTIIEGLDATMEPRRAFDVLFAVALSFFFSKLFFVILVEPPIARYLDAAAALLLTIPAALVVCVICPRLRLRQALQPAVEEDSRCCSSSLHPAASVACTRR